MTKHMPQYMIYPSDHEFVVELDDQFEGMFETELKAWNFIQEDMVRKRKEKLD